jgi:hypothetical protein
MDIMADGIPTRIFQSPVDDSRLYRMELLGTFLSAIAFGIILVILLSTLQILLRKTRVYSRVMQVTLLCYVVLMSSMSLLALAQQIVFVIRRAPGGSDLGVGSSSTSGPRSQINQTVALPFAIWGADTFLVRQFCISMQYNYLHYFAVRADVAMYSAIYGRIKAS